MYARRLFDAPRFNTSWPADAVPVGSDPSVQFAIRIVGNENAVATVAWLDRRTGCYSVCAHRLDADGVPAATPASFRLSAPFPNPARTSVVLALNGAGPASAEALDAFGRRVGERAIDGGETTSIRWDLGHDADRRVEPGGYFVRVNAPEREATRAVVVRR